MWALWLQTPVCDWRNSNKPHARNSASACLDSDVIDMEPEFEAVCHYYAIADNDKSNSFVTV